MKKWQFDRYIKSYKCRNELLSKIEVEITELYENVAPVLTHFYYDKLTAAGVSVEENAFYIIEQKEILSLRRNRIEKECEAVERLLETLTPIEKRLFFKENLNYTNFKPFAERLKGFMNEVEYLVGKNEESQIQLLNDDLEQLPQSEYDAIIDQIYEEAVLTGDESSLFEGYFDEDDTFDQSLMERKSYTSKLLGKKGKGVAG